MHSDGDRSMQEVPEKLELVSDKTIVHDHLTLENAIDGDDETRAPISEDEIQYPEGGWTAWSQVVAGNMLNMLAWGLPASFGVYQLYYTEQTRLSSSQASWIGSAQVFLTLALGTVSGRLADAGYSRHAVLTGCLVIVSGTLLTSFCTRYWQILMAQGVYIGLGLGMAYMPSIAVIGCYFKRRRSLALAISTTGGGFGSLIFPSVLQYLIPRVGFPWAVRYSALVALVMALVANLLLKPRGFPAKRGPIVDFGTFKEVPYLYFTIGVCLYFMALYFSFFHINAFARQVIGFSAAEAVSLLLITNAAGIPLRPIVGHIADRHLGPINTFIVAIFVLACMDFAWVCVKTKAGMYVFSVFLGMANGAAQGIVLGALASLTADPRKMGVRFGMVATLSGVATLAGPPMAGAIIDSTGGRYLWAQIWAGAVLLASSFIIAASRVSKSGKRIRAIL
ncbi:mfs monocarboxylate transporter [Diaporthe eres]|uniref:Major facilitator superfamily (MFS) profile domain-containing protein n=1 Tax=Diaporthe vaccinii TaxID=105482 RepID=A0ABR4EXD3_9PEZI|nr:mfs monocarboxylate transporter [Diaporthe eres]